MHQIRLNQLKLVNRPSDCVTEKAGGSVSVMWHYVESWFRSPQSSVTN